MCDGIENNVKAMFNERKQCVALVHRRLPAASNSDGASEQIAASNNSGISQAFDKS